MEKIGLDQPTLKALAGETRVRIMKLLDKKQLTQSDLANELRMSLPTIGEHLKALEHAELVEREQTERKWKYYSLTNKARLLLHPHTTTIWFVLGLFLFSAAMTFINALKYFSEGAVSAFGGQKMMAQEALTAEAAPSLAADAARAAPAVASPIWLIAFGIVTIVLLILLVMLLKRHGWLGKSLSNKKNI